MKKKMKVLSREFDDMVCKEVEDIEFSLEGFEKAIEDNLKKEQKYTKYLYRAREQLIEYEVKRSALYVKRYHHYKFEQNYTLSNADEIKKYVEGDEVYREENKKYQRKKLEIERLEDAIKGFKDRGWKINKEIEIYRLRNGFY